MIEAVSVSNFKAVRHLETSLLMANHPAGIKFSTTKPNVIVGPNGSGKSALLTALSFFTLSQLTGRSSLDNNFIHTNGADRCWSDPSQSWDWLEKWKFLEGLCVSGKFIPTLYYRPGHIPGNDDSITASMMCGYFKEAKAFHGMVNNKSSGQQCSALLEQVMEVLEGNGSPPKIGKSNWRYQPEPAASSHASTYDRRAQLLVNKVNAATQDGTTLVLMDEPEQSLDSLGEIGLWKKIEASDVSKLQVIVATHSLYPLLNPSAFNIIESVPGYADSVRKLVNS